MQQLESKRVLYFLVRNGKQPLKGSASHRTLVNIWCECAGRAHQNREGQINVLDKIAAGKRKLFSLWVGRECENNGHDGYLHYVLDLVEMSLKATLAKDNWHTTSFMQFRPSYLQRQS